MVESVVNEYVVWGGSNAGRLVDVMAKMGLKVVKVSRGGGGVVEAHQAERGEADGGDKREG